MSLSQPATKEEFIQNCLCRLGHPVIEVNIAPEQCEILVEQAIQKYWDHHFDGQIPVYYLHVITPTDITNNYIQIPDEIHGITKILPFSGEFSSMSGGSSASSLEGMTMHSVVTDLLYNNSGGVITGSLNYLYSIKEYLSTMSYVLTPLVSFQFNRKLNRVYINRGVANVAQTASRLLFEGFKRIDPNQFPEVWNDEWLKEYCAALMKKQWGENLKKFTGLPLPGGAQLNGEGIYNEAIAEIERLETRLYNEFSPPPKMEIA